MQTVPPLFDGEFPYARFSECRNLTLPLTIRHRSTGWDEYVHPEGDTYYYQPGRGLLTLLDPRQIGVTAAFGAATERISRRLKQASEASNVVVFCNMHDTPATGSGAIKEYYIVNDDTRSILWTEDENVATELAGPGGVRVVDRFESMDHRLGRGPKFREQVDYCPCHGAVYDGKAARQVIDILHPGCVEDMIAPRSIWPYSADERLESAGNAPISTFRNGNHVDSQAHLYIIDSTPGGTCSSQLQASLNNSSPPQADSIGSEAIQDPERAPGPDVVTGTRTPDEDAPDGDRGRVLQNTSARSQGEDNDAAGALLSVSQTNSRQQEDDLEAGVIRAQLEAETGLSPWLDLAALSPRTKLIITLVVLGLVLLGAFLKLVQTILSSSSAH
ncbi:hypothetical protein FS837_012520 [Tulasnella sp. UAMH 9824]|nr:hypothetical protein FS837_012520 [Tulasnella sp. UAMH 9824]